MYKKEIKARKKMIKFLLKESKSISYEVIEPYAIMLGILCIQIDRLKNQ